jgi:3-oxoacyl-[acyl-carrier protein] reductase
MTTPRKLALITGGGTGVGAATALRLAALGYDLVLTYSRSEAEARATAQACETAGASVLLQQGDVADDAHCQAAVAAAVEHFGRLDVLVNNAGMTSFAGAANWDAIDAEVFQRIVGVNALGSFQMIRAAAPHLTAAQGAIVNVSSIAGALGIGSSVAYIASKGALNAMTLYFARALAPAVRVNAVCPGLIETRWFSQGVGAEAYARIKQGFEAKAPLQRAASADDVADAVVWLAHGARCTTGELVLIDAGMHLGGQAARG